VFGTPAAVPETILPRLDHNETVVSERAETTSLANGLACGIDIEMVDNIPVVQDYWEEPFYTTTFTASEIAYCLLQNNPPMHFAARWCAKEALKKCDPAYSHVSMHQLEVALTPTGAPFLQAATHGTWKRLPVALSLSHTPHMAAAVVVKPSAARLASNGVKVPVVAPSPIAPGPSLPASSMAPTARFHRRCLPGLLGVGALVVALWALVRTW
jgi:phosphopantetheine--protein transferase-like protein